MTRSRPRDAQRSRLYQAETPVAGRRLPTLDDCAAYADSVVGSLWWHVRFPRLDLAQVPRLRPGYGARQAFYRVDPDGPTVTLPRKYRTSGVILHELTHWALDTDVDLPDHGRTFARVLLDATEEFGGVGRAERLLGSFTSHGVHVGRPARLGPDRLWHYGWDERLRLGRGRRLRVRYAVDGDPWAEVAGVFEGYARGSSLLRLRSRWRKELHVPAPAVWDVQPT